MRKKIITKQLKYGQGKLCDNRKDFEDMSTNCDTAVVVSSRTTGRSPSLHGQLGRKLNLLEVGHLAFDSLIMHYS